MGYQQPKFNILWIVCEKNADIQNYFKERVADTDKGKPDSQPEGGGRLREEEGEYCDQKASQHQHVVIGHFPPLEVLGEEGPEDHGEGAAAEEVGVVGLDDAGGRCEVGYEGTECGDVGAVAEEGDGVEGGVPQVPVVVYLLQHQNKLLNIGPIFNMCPDCSAHK